jgi:uncharacterized protein DUF5916/cellulose/xylan binding protein with CBM9 domain
VIAILPALWLQLAAPADSIVRPRAAAAAPVVSAVRTARAPILDGRLDDPAWASATVVTELLQSDPDEGRPVSEVTEVRVVYDAAALYVGARLLDRNPAGISRRLARRDVVTPSDEFRVMLDSYHDRRTAFLFAVNPAGVQRDVVYGDDGGYDDDSWDPVWQVAVSVDSVGWTAEMRIPFSQLRFSSEPVQVWGVRFVRWIQRKNELAFFPFVPKTETGLASRFAPLVGLSDLVAHRPAEVVPYTVARGQFHRRQPGDPFDANVTTFGGAGVDLKAGIASNLTLDVTVNPDFGQVELDPQFVNLTAFEQFLPEHRPFFVEGGSIFQFGSTGGGLNRFKETPLFFYSRRIGRPPQGDTYSPGQFADVPASTTILGATKLSGKTASGWSVGALEALTAREYGSVADTTTGLRRFDEVEPLSSYFTTRLKRDWQNGATTLGFLTTAVQRDLDRPEMRLLNSAAYFGGMDFTHRWHDHSYTLAGSLGGSYIRGDPAAIQIAQLASDRYFQRPDSRYLDYNPARTQLAGIAGDLYLNKVSGNWNWGIAGSTATPGFEVNDLGFQERVDRISTAAAAEYRWTRPGRFARQANALLSAKTMWNYEGDPLRRTLSAFLFAQFHNFWSADVNFSYDAAALDDRLTRGGPLAARPPGWTAIGEASTDNRKSVTWYAYAEYSQSSLGGWDLILLPSMSYRPSKTVSLSVGVDYDHGRSSAQYVQKVPDPTAAATLYTRYVFAELQQRSFDVVLRMNAAFSRTLSLQLFAQPFTFIGEYGGFKELAARKTYAFTRYGRDNGSTIDQSGSEYTVDPDGTGPAAPFTIENPDFRSRSFLVNGVLRWEYRPGSTIYLGWSQIRSGDFADAGASIASDFRRALFLDRPTNVLMVKVNCWLRP